MSIANFLFIRNKTRLIRVYYSKDVVQNYVGFQQRHR